MSAKKDQTGAAQTGETDVFNAIAHPVRRQLLDILSERDQTVKALAEPFAMSRPAISQHLKILLDAGIVIIREEGRLNYYHLQPDKLLEVQNWLLHYQQFWTEHLDSLGALLDETFGVDQASISTDLDTTASKGDH
jgi:DNA-binding transcriptional ArsR family regulator